jgi:hypothetical protein
MSMIIFKIIMDFRIKINFFISYILARKLQNEMDENDAIMLQEDEQRQAHVEQPQHHPKQQPQHQPQHQPQQQQQQQPRQQPQEQQRSQKKKSSVRNLNIFFILLLK